MTQENKQLLLKDLCARLLYRVKGVHILGDTIWSEEPETIENIDLQKGKIWTDNTVQGYSIEDQDFKPYLRPMSSMTEEEVEKYNELCGCNAPFPGIVEESVAEFLDWLNEHHFDYRNLIEKGLALEAPEEMY